MPSKHFKCIVCGTEANIEAEEIAPNVITWPIVFCGKCPSHPKMLANNTSEVPTHV